MLVCDVAFNPPETRLLAEARRHGLPALDGLAMLVYQGKKMWWAWVGGGHEYRDRVPTKKIGPFLARPEPQYWGQRRSTPVCTLFCAALV